MREAQGSELMREYWDSVAISLPQKPKYSRFGRMVAPYWRLERRLVVESSLTPLIPASGEEKVLLLKTDLWNEGIDDSAGDIHDFLGDIRRFAEVVGIDVSPIICRSAGSRARDEELKVACADVRRLPFRSGTFDAVLDVSTLDHIPPDNIALVIGEYKRVLREGGTLTLIFDSDTFWWVSYLRNIFNRLRCQGVGEFQFWCKLSPYWVRRKLSEHGFTIRNEFPLGILSLSPLYLIASRSNLVGKLIRSPLCSSVKGAKFTKLSRYLFPLASQYMLVAKKREGGLKGSAGED
ncbi:MAG TPA: methyltransferase domain-containing protein [Dehalococcoidia bacterium]|nr:methyltransferase domain-containing protein [Dehalococcoidia bacterium]